MVITLRILMFEMDFKFNFIQSEKSECVSAKVDTPLYGASFNSPLNCERPAKEIEADAYHQQNAMQHLIDGTLLRLSLKEIHRKYDLHYIPSYAVESKFIQNLGPESSLKKAVCLSSDLISGEYEGGLKLWECAVDLVNFLNGDKILELKNRKILELGCGAGLPGIYCLLNDATVHFQDYNEEVINFITIPNVFVNSKVHNVNFDKAHSKFFSGSWKGLSDLFSNLKEEDRYDYILMSETIYNPSNYEVLHYLLTTCLKTSGKIYVAAKTHYFGVGGSTELFKSFVTTRGAFKICSCNVYEEGIQREIFQLSFP